LLVAGRVEQSMKKVSPWLRARDWAGSIAGFLIVLIALVAVDDRVGTHVRALFNRGPAGDVGEVSDRVSALGYAVLMAARDQSIDHAPMLVFTAVAIVLVIMMLRT
jgi:hypothetical protein